MNKSNKKKTNKSDIHCKNLHLLSLSLLRCGFSAPAQRHYHHGRDYSTSLRSFHPSQLAI